MNIRYPIYEGVYRILTLILYIRHRFLRLNGVLKIATNGRNFLCCQAKKGSFGLPKHNLALQIKPPAAGNPAGLNPPAPFLSWGGTLSGFLLYLLRLVGAVLLFLLLAAQVIVQV